MSADIVAVYGVATSDDVTSDPHVVPPSLLTWNTTLAMPAVDAPVPVYDVSLTPARLNAGVRVPMTPSLAEDPSSVVVIVRVPTVGAVVSTVIFPLVVESADVTVLPAVSVTKAWIEYVVPLVKLASVAVYGADDDADVPLVVHVVPPSLLTWITTLEIAAVGAFVPVYDVSAAAERLNAGVRVPMIPSLDNKPSSVVVIVSVPAVGAVVSTVIRPFVVESAVVVVMPAVSVTNARTEYVPFVANAGDAVTVYAVAGEVGAVKVALSAQVDPSVLTCSTTLATAAVAAPVPV